MKINSYLAAALAALSILFSCSPEEENGSWEDYIKDKQGQQDKKDDEGKQPDDGLVEVEVRATDPYGRVYTCNEIVENGLEYPSYLY